MANKLKLEDTCLTVEQAKELQKIGVEMKDTAMVYCDFNDQIHEYELMINCDGIGIGACEVVPTLTNTEMFDMLITKYIYHDDNYMYLNVTHNDSGNYDVFFKRLLSDIEGPHYTDKLLRDSFFYMVMFLKTNKLI